MLAGSAEAGLCRAMSCRSHKRLLWIVLGLLCGSFSSSALAGLVWSDEFDGSPGGAPDPARWSFELGNDGWGNKELENYTDSRENARLVADPDALDGHALEIRAVRNKSGGYTSARLSSLGHFSVLHGRIEARIWVPDGKGLWPAFWMLGTGISRVGWPACGEIDIMEISGDTPGRLHGTIHGPGFFGDHGITHLRDLPKGTVFSSGYHIYAVEWSHESITWLVDGVPYATSRASDLPPAGRWVFDRDPFFLMLNLAVGGSWPGNPTDQVSFPKVMRVDFVRVYSLDSEP